MKKVKKYVLAKVIGLYINALSYIRPQKASAFAYRIFSEPRDGRLLKENLPEILQQAKTLTYNYNNVNFQAYLWQGNDNVILLVHGWESNASRWAQLLPYLQKSGSTIIALDAPGHGLSAGKEFNIPQYANYINVVAKIHNPSIVIGHSLGGAASIYYQSTFQNQKLNKLILLGAPSDFKILIHNYIALLSLNKRTGKLLEGYFYDRFKIKLDEFSGKIFGSNIRINGIIAHDVDDDVVLFEEAKKISSSWKSATFIQTKGLGHSMHDQKLYAQLSEFLFGAPAL